MREFSMTWNEAGKRWFKKQDGKQYAVSVKELRNLYADLVTADTKLGSYRAANEYWRIKSAQLTLEADDLTVRDLANERFSLIRSHKAGMNIDVRKLAEVEQRLEQAREKLPLAPVKKNSPSLAIQIGFFLQSRDVSAGRRDVLRSALEHFKAFKTDDTCQIDGMTLAGFKAFLLAKIDRGEMSRTTAYHIMSSVKQFIRWLYHTAEILDRLPKNIDEKEINVKMPTARPKKPMDKEQVESLLSACSGQQRLYYLLMLNCGMTQVDVADLRHDEVDWTEGRIIRQRSKTGENDTDLEDGDIPTVNYRLWDETFRLLKQCRSDHPQLVLVSERKTPLMSREFKSTGKTCIKRIDSIGLQYRRLLKRLNPKRTEAGLPELKELKRLRKTGSSLLDGHEAFGRYVIHWLGHSPRTVAGKHYVTPSQDRFDAAVCWLGQELGFQTRR